MNFLSIDCSTDIGTLFIKVKNKTFIKILQSDNSSNDLLMKKIIDFFHENNLNFNDITNIFINQGPGNFSGLRGSLSVAKGVSISKNISLFGYDTFLWASAKFFNKQNLICSFIKFREKYYVKKFDKKLNIISEANEVRKEEIINKYYDKFLVIPKTATKYFDSEILDLNNLKIVDLDHNELESLQLKGLLDEDLIKPIYLS